MLFVYFRTAIRNLFKTKLFTVLNLAGLSIGITASLIIYDYITFEKSYDSFHMDSDRIYRLRYERTSEDGSVASFASCTPPAGALIRERFSEVELVGRVFHYQANISYEENDFYEEKIFFADPDLFEILKFEFISGNPVKILKEPGNGFLSESMVQKYFGNGDPIGKTISIDRKISIKIVGVFKDSPLNSHIKFDFIFPYANLLSMYGDDYHLNWGHTGMYTYLKLKPGTDILKLKDNLSALVQSEFGEALEYYKMTMRLPLQPLEDIHLKSHYMQEYELNGNEDSVIILFWVAVFILVIGWINYINLTTARSLSRAREVGLRKVVGASRVNLGFQFFTETALVNILAIILSILFIYLLTPIIHKMTGFLNTSPLWTKDWFLPAILLIFLAGTLVAGLYPAIILSSFKPSKVLKGKFGSKPKGINFRKVLVIFQYAVAFILITATLTIHHQIEYMRNQDLGFDIEQIMVVKAPRVRDNFYADKANTFKNTLNLNSAVSGVCHVTEVPGKRIYWDAGGIFKVGDDISASRNYYIIGADYNFTDLFKLKFVAGRNFSKEHSTDSEALILNETAVKFMGFNLPDSAIGREVNYWGNIYKIIGILKDYHQQSLKANYEPQIFRLMPEGRGTRGHYAIKINLHQVEDVVRSTKELYAEIFPGNPFEYYFLDDYFNMQYKSDESFGETISLFALIAIIITILGIYGLATYNALQRIREIGIRKVLGAEAAQIIFMLAKDFILIIFFSIVAAFPLLLYGLDKFLDNYAFRINLTPDLFIIPIIIVVGISLLSMGYQYIRASVIRPVEVLRSE